MQPQERKTIYKISNDKMHVVAQKNDLIQKARHDLTVKELKLIDFMISKVKAGDNQLLEVKTYIKEINEVMDFGDGGKQLRDTADALINLRNKGFWIRTETDVDGRVVKGRTTTSWLAKATINDDNTCILQLDEDLAPYLLNIIDTGNYTQFYLLEILSLKGKHSLLLYRLAKSFQHLGNFGDELGEFMDYFGKRHETWNQFNQKYLKPAVEEINEKTDMKLTVETERSSNKVVGVYLYVEKQKRKKPVDQSKPKVPLHNWLKDI